MTKQEKTAKATARQLRWRNNHREEFKAYQREWKRRWKIANPEKYEKQRQTYNAKRKGQLQNVVAIRRDYISNYKMNKGCADCGYNKHYAALDFDHIRGEKLQIVSMLVLSNKEVLDREIEKCEVVCANCHRIRTAERAKLKRKVA